MELWWDADAVGICRICLHWLLRPLLLWRLERTSHGLSAWESMLQCDIDVLFGVRHKIRFSLCVRKAVLVSLYLFIHFGPSQFRAARATNESICRIITE